MYLALYRKWRPKNFDDVISQPHITSTLKNELKTNRTSHAYLFTGSRGTGKTTCAKIFAKAINCKNPENGEPCNKCEICKGLEDGSILDVTEMDGASNNSVNDIRTLRDEANFTPVSCKYRVYIIDEVHMLSTSAFNALLKIMEEPPEHVIFILATTEVHKIPATIISRCQRFDFHRIKSSDMAKRLLYIASEESLDLDEDAAMLIARLADGAMRDALSLLDQCSVASEKITLKDVSATVGIVEDEYLKEFHDSICNSKPEIAIKLIDELYLQSKDLTRLCDELIGFYRNLMLVKTSLDNADILDGSPEIIKQIKESSKDLDLSKILYILDTMQKASEKMSFVSNKKLELEMCFINICTKQTLSNVEEISNRIDSLEVEIKKRPASNIDSVPKPSEAFNSIPNTKNMPNLSTPPAPSAPAPNIIKNQKPSTPPKPFSIWPEVLEQLKQKDKTGMLTGFLSGSSAFVSDDRIFIKPLNAIVGAKVLENNSLLETILENKTGKKYRIFIKKSNDANSSVPSVLKDSIDKAKKAGVEIVEET